MQRHFPEFHSWMSTDITKIALCMTALLEDKYSISQHYHLSAFETPYQPTQADRTGRTNTNLCCPHTILSFPLFLYRVVLPLRSARPYCGSCLEGILHNQSLFGHKIHIATFNQNNSSLLMWQPQETGPHTSGGTNWSNCSTMHSSFQLNEHLNLLQLDTCV